MAMGAAESKGSHKGLIVNLDAAVSSIRRALEEAEGVAGVPVESAIVGVAGSHVRGSQQPRRHRAGQPRPGYRSETTCAERWMRPERSLCPEDREVLHVLPQEFLVDRQDDIRDPIGMMGQRLEVNVHIVTASAAATQNIDFRGESRRRGGHRYGVGAAGIGGSGAHPG